MALLTGPRAGIPTCRADHPCGSQRWLRVQGGDQGRWGRVVRMLGWETLCNCVREGAKEGGRERASERPDVPEADDGFRISRVKSFPMPARVGAPLRAGPAPAGRDLCLLPSGNLTSPLGSGLPCLLPRHTGEYPLRPARLRPCGGRVTKLVMRARAWIQHTTFCCWVWRKPLFRLLLVFPPTRLCHWGANQNPGL